ncbi:MAG: Methyltransferase type 11 [Chitinophagaceae bacterium]|nr:Methyltransferase type 11 [Chitinophagaceae bacterium]
MERERKPFEGLTNILKFNWHYYVLATLFVIATVVLVKFLPSQYTIYLYISGLLVSATVLISLIVSCYIYDVSELYQFTWLSNYKASAGQTIANIHAGFDETSYILSKKLPETKLLVFDFFDPEKHTEISIQRARNAYLPYAGTIKMNTLSVALERKSIDAIFLTFAAHEIRIDEERVAFFEQLKNSLTDSGKIFVTEHLRDFPNFLVYNIGFFHFLSRSTWNRTFKNAGLQIGSSVKATPFTTTFILEKNGDPS